MPHVGRLLFLCPFSGNHHRKTALDLKEIKQIISLMTRSDLSEFSIEEDGLKLRIRRGTSGPATLMQAPQVQMIPAPSASAALATPSSAPPSTVSAGAENEPGIAYIKSPMVGTLYRAPSPESPPFVDAGARVAETTPVCIIEAMKIMNEIQAEVKGVILEVLVDNGQPVEFGQRLFKVQVT